MNFFACVILVRKWITYIFDTTKWVIKCHPVLWMFTFISWGFARLNEQRVTGTNNQVLILSFQPNSSLWSWPDDWKSLISVKSYWQVQNWDCSIPEHAVKVVERKHQGEFSDTSGCSPNPLIRKWHQGLRGSPFKPANNRNLAWIINYGWWQAEWESDANLIPIRVLYNFVSPFFWSINNKD